MAIETQNAAPWDQNGSEPEPADALIRSEQPLVFFVDHIFVSIHEKMRQ